MIAALLLSYDNFFHRQVPPHLIAIVRIALGAFVLLYWLTEWSDARLFSAEGLLFPLQNFNGTLGYAIFHPPLWFVYVFFATTFLLLLFFTAGFFTRTSAFLILMAFAYFHYLSQWQFTASFYRLFSFGFLVFLLPGSDRAFSAAMLLKHGSLFAWEPVSIFSQRVFSLQVTATYFCVSWQKLFMPQWYSGTILLQGFTGRWATPFGFWLARSLPRPVIDLMLLGTVAAECLMPFGLWIRRAQPFFFVFGFLFHTMITLTMNIWWFQFLIPLYIVFLDPNDVFHYVRKRSRGLIESTPFTQHSRV